MRSTFTSVERCTRRNCRCPNRDSSEVIVSRRMWVCRSHVEADVIACRFGPINLVGFQADNFSVRLDDNALRGLLPRFQIGQKIEQLALKSRLRGMRQLLASVAQGLGQTVLSHRLQQVIERVHLEGLHRVPVVSGDKDGERHVLSLQGRDHAEAIHLRHLNIEKDEVRLFLLDQRDGRLAVAALGHDLQVGFIFQHSAQALARQRFIVTKQHSNGHRWSRPPRNFRGTVCGF